METFMLSNSKFFLFLALFAGSTFAAAADPNIVLELACCCDNEGEKIVKAQNALAHGADIEARSGNFQQTPLERAVNRHRLSVKMIQFLLANGADVNAANPLNGETPLHLISCHQRAAEIIPLLLKYDKTGQALFTQDFNGDTPCDHAMKCVERYQQDDYAPESISRVKKNAKLLEPLGG
jgi:ankyrin repeat protein